MMSLQQQAYHDRFIMQYHLTEKQFEKKSTFHPTFGALYPKM